MEKQLGWTSKFGGVELLWISKVSHTVLARLIMSQIWDQPISSLWEGLSKRTMALARPNARYFSLSLYPIGDLPAATLVVELRRSDYE